jgi:hypothetical protein
VQWASVEQILHVKAVGSGLAWKQILQVKAVGTGVA